MAYLAVLACLAVGIAIGTSDQQSFDTIPALAASTPDLAHFEAAIMSSGLAGKFFAMCSPLSSVQLHTSSDSAYLVLLSRRQSVVDIINAVLLPPTPEFTDFIPSDTQS
ncbi:hypothetical protein WJX73_001005 [Symbiochloris irregularis]|uniref:Uncharacterized protein n=1 Tax=Symbiochloris irregularis TaxID=706552 RepID=A0AAW1Q3U4_9CHLO